MRGAVVVAVLALGLLALSTDAGQRAELGTVDLRFDLRGDRAEPAGVAVVGIDDRTFNGLRDRGESFPLRRSLHGRVIDRLVAADARVIAYDIQFTEQSADGREDDALISSVADAPANNVVLATTEVDAEGRHAVLGGDETLRTIGARAGNAVMPTDPGGVVRRVAHDHDGLVSFAVAAVETATRGRVPASAFPAGGEAWIDFPGGPGTIRTLSFIDVLDGRFDPGDLRGRTVVVGATAPSLQDVKPTSTSGDGLMAGPEIQAAAIDTVARGLPLESSPWAIDAALLVLLGLVAPFAAARARPSGAVLLVALAAALYVLAVYVAFSEGLILRVTEPLLTLVVSAVAVLAVDALVASFERERLRDAFGRFVPPAIVDTVLARAGEDGWLGGERRETTVLFSDLRGFTTFSETRAPDYTLRLLNAYLGEMTTAIMGHGGTITSYIGDGIMALFGAPLEQADHADRALAAAREMQARLETLNERLLREEGLEEGFRMGIGLNTGPVMVGNVGSERRLEYTGIGDTVNTSARLEGMTKNSGFSIFVADSTVERLTTRPDDLRFVDELPVRGRAEPVEVWGLAVGPGTAPSPDDTRDVPDPVPAS